MFLVLVVQMHGDSGEMGTEEWVNQLQHQQRTLLCWLAATN